MNDKVADILEEIATLYTVDGDQFRAKSFSRGAKKVRGLDVDISTVEKPDKLPGIGGSIAKCIEEIVITGTCKRHEDLKASSIPPGIVTALRKIPGVGPVNAKTLYQKHNVTNAAEVKKLIDEGIIIDAKLKANVEFALAAGERIPIGFALPVVRPILEQIKATQGVTQAEFAGSLRRHKETVRDIDIIATTDNPDKLHEVFRNMGDRTAVEGDHKFRIFKDDMQIDLLIVPADEYFFSLLYFTGSKEANIKMRQKAKAKGWKLSEKELVELDTGKPVVEGRSEEEIFEVMGWPYLPPELREEWVVCDML